MSVPRLLRFAPFGPAHNAGKPVGSSGWTVGFFALGVLLLGLTPPALLFSLDPTTARRIGLGKIPIPAWVFTGVWLVAYPAMGVATWFVWRRRNQVDVSVPIVVFSAAFLQTLSFWLTNSIHMTAVLDAIGVVLAYTVAWVYSRYDQRAVWFLIPWLVWMPITLGFKVWALAQGVS